ncbi:hypothetical protein MUK42_06870 [Musa troglodytarum]|uniref:Uncharacterized protein n=1 Tax=Musa troglodytarum TaxID=320322 RepID=A0A9E7L8W1_9LILI|nr:hypothetical protein MUK42_06870 [Musa troglodytarum]URE42020.1 hypothetical protein MUK42_06870 [Musa troglodytarum]
MVPTPSWMEMIHVSVLRSAEHCQAGVGNKQYRRMKKGCTISMSFCFVSKSTNEAAIALEYLDELVVSDSKRHPTACQPRPSDEDEMLSAIVL